MWRLLALRGNRDSAFALLTRAKSIHNNDMTQLEVDSAYASLRHDARYAPLLPTTHDFVNLFVEDVKVIREIDGDSTGDQFGWIERSIAGAPYSGRTCIYPGDVDHDGDAELVVGSWQPGTLRAEAEFAWPRRYHFGMPSIR